MNENTYYKFTNKSAPDECFYAYCNYPLASDGLLVALGIEGEYAVAIISEEEYIENTKED